MQNKLQNVDEVSRVGEIRNGEYCIFGKRIYGKDIVRSYKL